MAEPVFLNLRNADSPAAQQTSGDRGFDVVVQLECAMISPSK
jgi:hypothetical protein